MNPSHAQPSYGPRQWQTAAFVLSVTAVFIVGLVVWYLARCAVRVFLWPREQERRARLVRAMAVVEVCDRLNGHGACDLIVAFETTPSYRQTRHVRLRTLQFFPGDTIEQLAAQRSIPLLIDADDVQRSVVDFEALLGTEAASIARRQYIRGTAPWRVLGPARLTFGR